MWYAWVVRQFQNSLTIASRSSHTISWLAQIGITRDFGVRSAQEAHLCRVLTYSPCLFKTSQIWFVHSNWFSSIQRLPQWCEKSWHLSSREVSYASLQLTLAVKNICIVRQGLDRWYLIDVFIYGFSSCSTQDLNAVMQEFAFHLSVPFLYLTFIFLFF